MKPHNRNFAALILSALGLGLGLTGCATTSLREGAPYDQPARQFPDSAVRIEVPIPSETLLDRISVGSGFLLSSKTGVTCAHVLRGQSEDKPVKAFISGHEHTLQVVGTDEKMDIAVFTITPPASSAAVLPQALPMPRVAQPVCVAGFPLPGVIVDKRPSVTGGIVSGINRSVICDGERIDGLIQIDAVASEGNSGGPVTTPEGQVIGMVVFAATGPHAEWRGATFAIPIKEVESVAEEIINKVSAAQVESNEGLSDQPSVKGLITK